MSAKIKPVTAAMKSSIIAKAKALAINAPDISTGAGKAYEAWMLLEIAAELQTAGLTVEAKDHACNTTTDFRVSGGPQHIPAATSTDLGEPCHFELRGKNLIYELHAGVRHSGQSSDNHELDISVFAKRDADLVRGRGGGPATGPIYLALELKEYSAGSYLPKVYSRALLGSFVDLNPLGLFRKLVLEFSTVTLDWRREWSPDFWLVTSANIRTGHVKFLERYGIDARSTVEPNTPGDVIQVAAERLMGKLW